jgi:hypothetical protein
VFSPEEIEKAKRIVAELSQVNRGQDCKTDKMDLQSKKKINKNNQQDPKKKKNSPGGGNSGTGGITLLPSELLVIAGIVCDVLQVNSVLVSRNQTIEIVLTGSLKRRTQLDKVMQQVGQMPFDQVMKCIMNGCSDDG